MTNISGVDMSEHRYSNKSMYKYDVSNFVERYLKSEGFHTYTYTCGNELKIDGSLKSHIDKITKCNINVTISTKGRDLLIDVSDLKSRAVFWGSMLHAVINPFGMIPSLAVAGKSLKDLYYQNSVGFEIDRFMDSKR